MRARPIKVERANGRRGLNLLPVHRNATLMDILSDVVDEGVCI